jgi:hypothetical protein
LVSKEETEVDFGCFDKEDRIPNNYHPVWGQSRRREGRSLVDFSKTSLGVRILVTCVEDMETAERKHSFVPNEWKQFSTNLQLLSACSPNQVQAG